MASSTPESKAKIRWIEVILIIICILLAAAVITFVFFPELYSVNQSNSLEQLEPPRFVYSDWEHSLYIADKHGENAKRIFTNRDMSRISDPDWSPDGKYIVFSAIVDDNWDLYRIDADGKNLLRLTYDEAGDTQPDWSPDSSRIVFWSMRDRQTSGNLYLINPDGSGVREIDFRMMVWRPEWWPNGKLILCQGLHINQYSMILVDPDDGSFYTIGDPVDTGGRREDIYTAPAVSPAGDYIAFITHANLHIMKSNLSEDRVVASSDSLKPAWSPDGAYLIFQRSGTLQMLDTKSLEITYLSNLLSDSGMIRGVSWGPLE